MSSFKLRSKEYIALERLARFPYRDFTPSLPVRYFAEIAVSPWKHRIYTKRVVEHGANMSERKSNEAYDN